MQWNMFWGTVDTMSQTKRITHIDSLRGAAVLLMVMVHAAATWNPFQTPQISVLAYVVSGLGGLAAPMFVTLFGWGILRSTLSLKPRMWMSSENSFFETMVVNSLVVNKIRVLLRIEAWVKTGR